MSEIVSLLHASLLVADVARARDFYEGVLGLVPSPARPVMGFEGVWYDIDQAQIHLICQPNPDPVAGRPAHGGRDRHTALGVKDWAGLRARLRRQACTTPSASPAATPCSCGIRTATPWNWCPWTKVQAPVFWRVRMAWRWWRKMNW